MKTAVLLLILCFAAFITVKAVSETTYAIQDTKRVYFQVQSEKGFLDILPYVHHRFPNKVYSVSAPESEIEKLKNNPLLIFQGDVSIWEVNQSKTRGTSCIPTNQLLLGNQVIKGNESNNEITVAVLDTGVTKDHSDLSSNIVDCKNMQVSSLQEKCDDKHGHGTHTTGVIAANGKMKGIAPNASIASLQTCSSSGRCYGDDVAMGILYAVNKGYQIINLGLGGDSISPVEQQTVEYALEKGAFIIASAGNNGITSAIEYPAVLKGVVSVGALDRHDSVVSFSSGGSHVSLLAPGVSVESTFKDGCYATWSGTSVSTSYVSGLAALAWKGDSTKTYDYLQNLLGKYDTDSVSLNL